MAENPDNSREEPDRASGGTDRPGRQGLVQGLTVVVVAVWCINALAIGVNTAGSLREWLPIFAFEGVAPALFLWHANRASTPR